MNIISRRLEFDAVFGFIEFLLGAQISKFVLVTPVEGIRPILSSRKGKH